MPLSPEEVQMHFRKRGHKFTSQRLAIYRALASSKLHPSVELLYSTVKKSHPTLSMNTVYNTLETLKEIGIVSEISLWHDRARFDANQTAHHHLACLDCKKIEDLYDENLDNLKLSSRLRHKYKITGYRVEFHGFCYTCQQKKRKNKR